VVRQPVYIISFRGLFVHVQVSFESSLVYAEAFFVFALVLFDFECRSFWHMFRSLLLYSYFVMSWVCDNRVKQNL